jgi:DNA (cytosine-5)-methyltransferase 1
MGAPEVDANHYLVSRWWDGSDCAATLTKQNANGAQRMPDKDNFGAVVIAQDVAATLNQSSKKSRGIGFSNQELFSQSGANLVAFRKSKRAQSATDDESSIPAEQANTLNQFDTGERDTHAVAHAFYSTGGTHGVNQHSEVSPAVKVGSGLGIPSPPAVAHALRAVGFVPKSPATSRSIGAEIEKSPTVTTHQAGQGLFRGMTVRRLTPRECERLQGFPDDWTLIPWRKRDASDCPDGPRYKALGNSMAVNCMEWIGERIAAREAR